MVMSYCLTMCLIKWTVHLPSKISTSNYSQYSRATILRDAGSRECLINEKSHPGFIALEECCSSQAFDLLNNRHLVWGSLCWMLLLPSCSTLPNPKNTWIGSRIEDFLQQRLGYELSAKSQELRPSPIPMRRQVERRSQLLHFTNYSALNRAYEKKVASSSQAPKTPKSPGKSATPKVAAQTSLQVPSKRKPKQDGGLGIRPKMLRETMLISVKTRKLFA